MGLLRYASMSKAGCIGGMLFTLLLGAMPATRAADALSDGELLAPSAEAAAPLPPAPLFAPTYTANDLHGAYSIHDVFAQLDGQAAWRTGTRQFDGVNQVGVVETGAIYSEPYLVQSDGRFRFGSDPVDTFLGTVGGFGDLGVHTRRALKDEDPRLTAGYAGLRLSVLRTAGHTSATFTGAYSYHALIGLANKNWRTLFGSAAPDGTGQFVLALSGLSATAHTYTVFNDGKTMIDGKAATDATLSNNGDVLFQTVHVAANADPQIPEGYTGLALYVRRSETAATSNFVGAYRVHEVRVRGDHAQVMGVGAFKAAGNGIYAGTITRNGTDAAFSGLIKLNPSGTFSISPSTDIVGTLSPDGRLAVVTNAGGVVQDEGGGETWLQLWVRSSGGEVTADDADGDGLLDGIDPQPLIKNNSFTVTPVQLSFQATAGGSSPAPQTLTLSNDANPFFYWSLTSDRSWLSATPSGALGSGMATVAVDSTGFQASQSPYTGTITVTAPGMSNSPLAVPVQVTVAQEPASLSVSPTSLAFTGFENAPLPAAQTVQVSNGGGGTLHWTATPSAAWISAQPPLGDGAANVAIRVNTAGLSSSAPPFQGTIRFAATGATNSPTDVAVTLTMYGSRNPGDPFFVAPDANVQSEPGVTYDAIQHRYAVVWTQNAGIRASLLDRHALPLQTPIAVSADVAGLAAKAVALPCSAQNGFWVIWEKRSTSGAPADLVGRLVSPDAKTLGPVMNFAAAAGSQESARGAFNSDRNEVALAYSSSENGNFDIRLARFAAATGASLGSTLIAGASGNEVSPWIGYDAVHHEYLTAWSDQSTVPAQLRYVRVSPATGLPLSWPLTLSSTPGAHEAPRITFNAAQSEWAVLWQVAAGGANGYDLLLARFPAGVASPALTVQTLMTGAGDQVSGALGYSGTAQQYLPLWVDRNANPDLVKGRRLTASGLELGPVTSFVFGTGDQATPVVAHNPDDNEFLAIWQGDRNGLVNVFGERVPGGSPDEDSDGLPNDFELLYGLDPFNATGDNGGNGDPDGDGWTNATELIAHTNPKLADTDGDGLADPQEDLNANGVRDPGETSATLADTDGDQFNDGAEWFLGTDPADASKTPPTALYRIEYGTWRPGVAGEVKVYAAIAAAGTYTLSLNSPSGIQASPGWSAVAVDALSGPLTVGSQAFRITVTPGASVTPQTAIGDFAFRLTDGAAIDQTLTARMVCDARSTVVNADALAQAYAPVLKMHHDEFYAPAPVDLSLSRATLRLGNGHTLVHVPHALDIAQSAQAESRLDLNGTTLEQLRTGYSAAGNPNPIMYYTATPLGASSVEAGTNPAHIAVQYYIHFFADEWGAYAIGGHRHEGDWEMVQILFDAARTPYRVSVTQQWQLAREGGTNGGESVAWAEAERLVEGNTHPVLYVGEGGHSLYFQPGSTRYGLPLEVHDGLGTWFVPTGAGATSYGQTAALGVQKLNRLGDPSPTPWLRFAGLWGQDAFPAGPDDQAGAGTQSGPFGPVFLGTTSDAASPSGVRSAWLDPYAWAQRMPLAPSTPVTTVRGILPADLFGLTVVLCDGRGRAYRGTIASDTGVFAVAAPAGTYLIAVVERDALTHETFRAVGRFNDLAPPETLFPTQTDGTDTDLGAFTLIGEYLVASTIYSSTDADGDGIPNASDPDMDNDGILNESDPDALGDGWLDAFQRQDPDQDGIPNYFDLDDDGDGIPDASDPDRNGDSLPDAQQPPDRDHDGFIDAIDLDLDNDGFTNAEERAAGSNPLLYRDTPLFKLGDIDGNGNFDAVDIQSVINMALGLLPEDLLHADFDDDGRITAVDVQNMINRALGIS